MDESLRKLPPAERVKALRALQEKKRKELEELEKKSKEEFDEAEADVKKSLEEIEEERGVQLQSLQEQLAELEDEEQSLEQTVAVESERFKDMGSDEGQYIIPGREKPSGGYKPGSSAAEDMYSHGGYNSNSQENAQRNTQDPSGQYKPPGENLIDSIDTSKNLLEKLGYKHL